MLFTFSEIITLIKFVLFENVLLPIAVTVFPSISSGTTTLPPFPVYPVIVTLSPDTVYVKSPYVRSEPADLSIFSVSPVSVSLFSSVFSDTSSVSSIFCVASVSISSIISVSDSFSCVSVVSSSASTGLLSISVVSESVSESSFFSKSCVFSTVFCTELSICVFSVSNCSVLVSSVFSDSSCTTSTLTFCALYTSPGSPVVSVIQSPSASIRFHNFFFLINIFLLRAYIISSIFPVSALIYLLFIIPLTGGIYKPFWHSLFHPIVHALPIQPPQ